MKYDYTKWALQVAAQCMKGDLDCGLATADDTPDPDKAREAYRRLSERLWREADRRSFPTTPGTEP